MENIFDANFVSILSAAHLENGAVIVPFSPRTTTCYPNFPPLHCQFVAFIGSDIELWLGIFTSSHTPELFSTRKMDPTHGQSQGMGIGVMMLSLIPALIALARGVGLYMVASVVGGVAWALAGGVLFNYLLEKVPEYDRPAYLAWYMLGFNAAILLGSMIGPAVAAEIGLIAAMAIFAVVRFVAGVTILRWG